MYVIFNMQLLRAAVNIHQQQIIQQQVFNKIVLIKSFFICDKKILNLKGRDLAYHVNIITFPIGKKYVFQLMFIKNLKKLISLHDLTVCRGFNKGKYLLYVVLLF